MEENYIEERISTEKEWAPIGSHKRNGAENIITIVANIILILGIIAAVIFAYQYAFGKQNWGI